MNFVMTNSTENRIRGAQYFRTRNNEQKKFRVHSLRKHRQQLASCATLWRLFPTRDREHELSFLLLFVFSLRKAAKKWKKNWNVKETRDGSTNTSARRERKTEFWEMKLWKTDFIMFFFLFAPCQALHKDFLKRRANQSKQISSFPRPFSCDSRASSAQMERHWAHCVDGASERRQIAQAHWWRFFGKGSDCERNSVGRCLASPVRRIY